MLHFSSARTSKVISMEIIIVLTKTQVLNSEQNVLTNDITNDYVLYIQHLSV